MGSYISWESIPLLITVMPDDHEIEKAIGRYLSGADIMNDQVSFPII